MGKILKEYITSLGHWGWLVVGDIFSGITGAYLDVSGTLQFPTWLWMLLLGIAFIIVPFLAYRKLWLQTEALKLQLQNILNAKPRLVITDIDEHKKGISIVNPKTGISYGSPSFTRLWIANKPERPESGVIAEYVYSKIEFYNHAKGVLFTINGKWAEGGQPALGASSLQTQQITMHPNEKPFCLDIGLKYLDDDEFYGFDDQTTLAYKAWKNPYYRLDKSIYFVKVLFTCKGLIQPFYFYLENKGKEHDVIFREISESDFHKEDSQTE